MADRFIENSDPSHQEHGASHQADRRQAPQALRALEAEVTLLRQRLKAESHRRRLAEEALIHSRSTFRQTFELSPNAIWVQRWADEVITEINPGFENLLGYCSTDLRGKTCLDMGIWPEQAQYDNLMRKLHSVATAVEVQADLCTKDGRLVHTQIIASLITLDGKPHVLAIARDITDLRKTLTCLRDSEETYRTVFENTGAATVVVEADMTISMANDRCERICGYAREEIEGRMKLLDIIAPEHRDMVRLFHHSRREGKPHVPTEFELTLIQKDGRPREVIASVRLIPGTQRGIVTIIDMSEKHHAEQERLRLAAVIEQTSEAVLITDALGVIHYVNPSVEALTGSPPVDFLGQPLDTVIEDPEAGEAIARMMRVGSTENAWFGRIERRMPSGTVTIADTRIYPISNHKGELISYVCMQRDITHETHMETQLRRAQKMEAIGTLASGIAHDFNNILTGLIGHAELAGKEAPPESRTKERIDNILTASLRARDLVNQILTYTRQKEQVHEPVEIRLIVKEALKLLKATLPAEIEIQHTITRESGFVIGNPSELHQVILNLCTNAAHAMGAKGGTLFVRVTNHQLNKAHSVATGGLKPGAYTCLTIADTGYGMTAETMERIFEPYFTTKEQGEGTGLGLAVTHGIVTRLEGQIDIHSSPGKGARFDIYLPRASQTDVAAKAPRTKLPTGDAHILIVDDETVIIDLLTEILSSLGYRVTAEQDGYRALTLFEAAPELVDLVITDLNMPGLNGKELIEAIRNESPEKPILVITGNAEPETETDPVIRQAQAFLRKPIRMTNFAQTVHKLLN
jgi:two-component system, cell cycle sensor histidine kinase and response regulator CckA